MDGKNPALILAAIDAAAIIGGVTYLVSRLNEQQKEINQLKTSVQQISTWMRANIDPKPLVGLGQRLEEYDGHVERLDPLETRSDKLEQQLQEQQKVIESQHLMVQSLINALDRAGITYDIPDGVLFDDASVDLDSAPQRIEIVTNSRRRQEVTSKGDSRSDQIRHFEDESSPEVSKPISKRDRSESRPKTPTPDKPITPSSKASGKSGGASNKPTVPQRDRPSEGISLQRDPLRRDRPSWNDPSGEDSLRKTRPIPEPLVLPGDVSEPKETPRHRESDTPKPTNALPFPGDPQVTKEAPSMPQGAPSEDDDDIAAVIAMAKKKS